MDFPCLKILACSCHVSCHGLYRLFRNKSNLILDCFFSARELYELLSTAIYGLGSNGIMVSKMYVLSKILECSRQPISSRNKVLSNVAPYQLPIKQGLVIQFTHASVVLNITILVLPRFTKVISFLIKMHVDHSFEFVNLFRRLYTV